MEVEMNTENNNNSNNKKLPILTEEDLDSDFKYETLKEPGGENFLKCIECGTCTASCPLKEIDREYNCRRIIRLATLGAKDLVLNSKFVWMCASCYCCYERCPWDVKITDLMNAFKNLAVRNGYIHPNLPVRIDILRENGGLFEINKFINKTREKLNLPPIQGYKNNIINIFKATKIKDVLEGNGR